MGDRAAHLAAGLEIVCARDDARTSQVYETEPVGGVDQDDFWNMVVEIISDATPRDLLERARAAEAARDRVRDVRWGPRTLDVDVLLVGNEKSDDPEILVPHPRLFERLFVLVPLHELAPDVVSEAQVRAGVGRVRALGTLETLR